MATAHSKVDVADFGHEAFKATVDKSIAAFDGFASNSKLNLEAISESASAAAEGAQTLGAQAAAYTKKALEDHVSVAKKLAGCKSVQEVMDIQTVYAKSAMEGYLSELTRWSDCMAASVQRSMKPINDRVAAAAEQFALR